MFPPPESPFDTNGPALLTRFELGAYVAMVRGEKSAGEVAEIVGVSESDVLRAERGDDAALDALRLEIIKAVGRVSVRGPLFEIDPTTKPASYSDNADDYEDD